ncbi:LysR family transcriptional regulator [Paenibacillus sp. YIM B09110]|uniref:LysR family transcriptional regulator n=1 Tax=Paenibacillus sp. YIM B09110 TaxID=3126102 RepID=UPI00301CE117
MHIEKLQYIVEVAKTGSISAAAQNLHVTLSAISQSITSLETEWGVALFVRSRTGASPTAEGKLIIKKAFELLSKYEELKELAMSNSNTMKGELRISTIPSPMTLLVNSVIGFKKDFPNISMEIIEKGSQVIIDDIIHNRSDLGFIILYEDRLIDNTGLSFEPLMEVRMVAAGSRKTSLGIRDSISPDELRQETIVLYNDDYVNWFMNDFQQRYGPVDILFTTNNRDSIRKSLMDHLAITVGVSYSFEEDSGLANREYVVVDIDVPQQKPVYLGWIQSQQKQMSAVSKSFINRLKHELSIMMK